MRSTMVVKTVGAGAVVGASAATVVITVAAGASVVGPLVPGKDALTVGAVEVGEAGDAISVGVGMLAGGPDIAGVVSGDGERREG